MSTSRAMFVLMAAVVMLCIAGTMSSRQLAECRQVLEKQNAWIADLQPKIDDVKLKVEMLTKECRSLPTPECFPPSCVKYQPDYLERMPSVTP